MNKMVYSKAGRIFISTIILLLLTSALFAQQEDALEAFRAGRYNDAIRITSAEITSNPRNMDSYAVQGWALLAMARWSDAVDLAQRGLQQSRYDHRIVAIMGEAQYRLGNYTSALQYLQEYVAIRPQGTIIDDIYVIMAEAHAALNEFHRADIAMSAALQFDPGNAEVWARLGAIRELAGDGAHAVDAYERALQLNGNLAEARAAITRLREQG